MFFGSRDATASRRILATSRRRMHDQKAHGIIRAEPISEARLTSAKIQRGPYSPDEFLLRVSKIEVS